MKNEYACGEQIEVLVNGRWLKGTCERERFNEGAGGWYDVKLDDGTEVTVSSDKIGCYETEETVTKAILSRIEALEAKVRFLETEVRMLTGRC